MSVIENIQKSEDNRQQLLKIEEELFDKLNKQTKSFYYKTNTTDVGHLLFSFCMQLEKEDKEPCFIKYRFYVESIEPYIDDRTFVLNLFYFILYKNNKEQHFIIATEDLPRMSFVYVLPRTQNLVEEEIRTHRKKYELYDYYKPIIKAIKDSKEPIDYSK